jgi:hypothetical protein
MSDEEQREVAKRFKSPWQQGMDVHSSGGEGSEEEERVDASPDQEGRGSFMSPDG